MDTFLDYEIVETEIDKNRYNFAANVSRKLLQQLDANFDATVSAFWFRFFGEVDMRAQRFDSLTDVTLYVALDEDAQDDRALAASIFAKMCKRAAWGAHAAELQAPNVDAIYISCENLRADETPREPSVQEAERLDQVRAAFANMVDTSELGSEAQADFATKIVTDLLLGEFEADAKGAMATVLGVWVGDRVSELTGMKWHCIDEGERVTYCVHNPARKISCFPFDALNKRLNAGEVFQPHLLAASFAEALGAQRLQ